ncbi:dienelactone hydrolase family protein [Bradyrhizobium sp. 35]|uniref:dienelactone hydrolase family protein n=1 Tax=Bradyrhizobium sp. 35 TaxID=2782670 RepID=UPI001FFB82EB|nr:dienelactone hydrolase family protein [Bradyrhizobium sp. 35]MCK1452845.1 dienelactone hydrolase family protein [Bradyrhizobium sp. 35]
MNQRNLSHDYTYRIGLLMLATLFVSSGHAQAAPVGMPPADSPYPDVAGAQWTKIEGASGRKFLTAIFRPEGTGPFPVVVVLHSAGGLTRDNMSVAEDLAHAGFLVVYGCWQAGQRQTEGNRLCSEATPQTEWVADPAANSGKELIALARTLPDAQPDHIGLFGISRGGHAALWAASTGAGVQAVVADAPAHTPALNPHPASTLDALSGLAAPLLIMHGTADKDIPVEQSREYERAALALGKSVVAVYFEGVEHMVTLRRESRAEARQRGIAFLREHLLK